MKNYYFLLLYLLLTPVLVKSQSTDTIRLYFLGGQSNMDGFGYNKDLPSDLNKTFKNVWIFHGNSADDGKLNGGLGSWEALQPGHGISFSSDGKTNNHSDRFGVEMTFAQQLEKFYPNQTIALIKYSKGGSSIDSLANRFGCWEPDFQGENGINQYDHFLTTLNGAFQNKDINNNGIQDVLVPCGIIWMQGESDGAYGEEIALRYYDHLKRLMDLMRASLRVDDLPVVIGKISDSGNTPDGIVWPYGNLVQYAQEKFARSDANAAIVRSTKNYNYSDTWHYDSEGYLDLGKQFADAIFKLEQEK